MPSRFERILVPSDFSERADLAIEESIAIAGPGRPTLLLLHVIPPLSGAARHILGDQAAAERGREARTAAEEQLADLGKRAAGERADIERHVAEGVPYEQIVEHAQSLRADAIALASQGVSGLQRYAIGSTAERVAREARCSVLVVRRLPGADASPAVRQILAPTDFSEPSLRAVDAAAALAADHGAQLTLLTVIPETDLPTGQLMAHRSFPNPRDEFIKGVKYRLGDMRQERIGDAVQTSVEARVGVPSAEIADVARDLGADLIFMAPNARKGLARFLLGSTAERVVRAAPCSVLVYRAPSA